MTYFISGHRDLTWEEFAKWYAPVISRIVDNETCPKFVVGDCEGADRMAQEFLLSLGVLPESITVYYIGNLLTVPPCKCNSGFQSDEERDAAMTRDSDEDIAFIRKGKETSGTAQNILRRWTQ